METGTWKVKTGLAQMLKGGVIMDVVTPEQFLGDIISDLNSRRGHIETIETHGGMCTIHSLTPLAETFGYTTNLRSLTQGRATHSMEYYQYQELSTELMSELKTLGKR